jgi:hypothetical protein
MLMPGLSQLGSSSVPALMTSKSGMPLGTLHKFEPHRLQKCRVTVFPLSAVVSNWVVVPFTTLKAGLGTKTFVLAWAPLVFWQSVQKQWATAKGSARHS